MHLQARNEPLFLRRLVLEADPDPSALRRYANAVLSRFDSQMRRTQFDRNFGRLATVVALDEAEELE
jgi:hypothetical protein